ncbi:MAG: helix-turn-helix transcriptional regulator [Geobacteraceae bacterium]|nr:helix-turn-helix transcriptional regulator [Geobacteraceae bacterium]
MESQELQRFIGDRIRTLRKAAGLSQEILAERAGRHPTFVGDIEMGRVNASLTTLAQIATGLGITLSELLELPKGGEGTVDKITTDLMLLYQRAKKLDDQKKRTFVDAASGILSGIEKM